MPGTFLSFADATNSELTDKLGTMLTLLNDKFKGGQDYGIITDKQWRSVSRTQLHEKCQEEKFDSMLDLFNEMEAEYHTNFKTSLSGLLVICNAGTKDQIQTFVSAGRIFQIFAGSLCLYKNLLLKIQKLAQQGGWDYAVILLDYYAKALSRIRTISSSWLLMVF